MFKTIFFDIIEIATVTAGACWDWFKEQGLDTPGTPFGLEQAVTMTGVLVAFTVYCVVGGYGLLYIFN